MLSRLKWGFSQFSTYGTGFTVAGMQGIGSIVYVAFNQGCQWGADILNQAASYNCTNSGLNVACPNVNGNFMFDINCDNQTVTDQIWANANQKVDAEGLTSFQLNLFRIGVPLAFVIGTVIAASVNMYNAPAPVKAKEIDQGENKPLLDVAVSINVDDKKKNDSYCNRFYNFFFNCGRKETNDFTEQKRNTL